MCNKIILIVGLIIGNIYLLLFLLRFMDQALMPVRNYTSALKFTPSATGGDLHIYKNTNDNID